MSRDRIHKSPRSYEIHDEGDDPLDPDADGVRIRRDRMRNSPRSLLLLWQAEEAFVGFRRELSTLFKGVARVHASLAQVIN